MLSNWQLVEKLCATNEEMFSTFSFVFVTIAKKNKILLPTKCEILHCEQKTTMREELNNRNFCLTKETIEWFVQTKKTWACLKKTDIKLNKIENIKL
jgi:hypothetical protein